MKCVTVQYEYEYEYDMKRGCEVTEMPRKIMGIAVEWILCSQYGVVVYGT
jgi:hypothetical protein